MITIIEFPIVAICAVHHWSAVCWGIVLEDDILDNAGYFVSSSSNTPAKIPYCVVGASFSSMANTFHCITSDCADGRVCIT
jgi:hypothetical protein